MINPTTYPPYFWQANAWTQFMLSIKQQRLPHALLIQGAEGMGKHAFALASSKLLLCLNATDQPCHQCRNCHLMQNESHPDVRIIKLESPGKTIKIEQIRETTSFLNETAQLGGYKIVLVSAAETMNLASQNALLKTLEEPASSKTLMMLVCSQPASLLPTVRSRCQRIVFHPPNNLTIKTWLSQNKLTPEAIDLALLYGRGAPLQVLQAVESDDANFGKDLLEALQRITEGTATPIDFAEKWAQKDLICIINWLLSWTVELTQIHIITKSVIITDKMLMEKLISLCNHLNINKLFLFIDSLYEVRKWCEKQLNINTKLLVESLLSKWMEVGHRNEA